MQNIKVLKNNLKVAAQPMEHMESVSIGIWIRTGSRYENNDNNGISHLLEHLLFKGTVNRDMKTIKEEVEGRGGTFNGFTSEEFTCYLVKLLSKDANLGVDILSDMVLNPRLASEEIDKEKSVIVEEINMYKDMPSHYVQEILAEVMWPGEPIGMPIAGTQKSVNSLTRNDLVSHKDNYYNPKNMLLMAAGCIEEDDLAGMADKYLSKAAAKMESKFNRIKIHQTAPVVKVYNKDTEQTHLAMGFHSLDRFHPDKYALSVANVILGANMSSRLFNIVRDEMALCYEISSSARKYEDSGALVISAGVDDKKLVKALEVILKELYRIKKEPVDKGEIALAK